MSLIKSLYAICNPLVEPDCQNGSSSIAADPITYVNTVIQTIISLFLIVGVIYFIWHFIMSAYHMISSNGDPKKWEEAQKSILYSFVGIFAVFSIFAILKFVGIIFGIESLALLTLEWPSLSN